MLSSQPVQTMTPVPVLLMVKDQLMLVLSSKIVPLICEEPTELVAQIDMNAAPEALAAALIQTIPVDVDTLMPTETAAAVGGTKPLTPTAAPEPFTDDDTIKG